MPSLLGSSRPRRATKPTSRVSHSAAAGSSSVLPCVSTSKVTKPKRVRTMAERKSDAAVTANLVGTVSAPEPQKEVVLEPV